MSEPLPRRRDGRGCHWRQVVLFLLGLDDAAGLVLAKSQSEAHLIRGFLVDEGLDDEWPCEVDEGIAGRLEGSIEQLTEVLVDEIRHCQFVVGDVVFHHSEDDDADSAFVLEPTILSLLGLGKLLEVGIGAVLLHLSHFLHHQLEVLLPVAALSQPDDFSQGLMAIDCLHHPRGFLDDLQVLMQHLHGHIYLHGDGEGSTSIAVLMRLHHFLQLWLAILKQGGPADIESRSGDHKQQQKCTNGSHLIGFIMQLIIAKILVEVTEGKGVLVWCYQQSWMQKANKQQENSVQLKIEKQEELSKQMQPPSSQSVQKKEIPPSCLRAELLAMQFDPSLVDRVLQQTDNLQKAIQLIVSELEQQDIQSLASSTDVHLVLLVRMDLKMGLGKIAAQCAHATLKAYQQARNRAHSDDNYSLTFIQWLQGGQEKVAYQVADQQQLFETLKKFEAMAVGTCYIRDAGRTQIAAGSSTVGGVGPWGAKQLEAVTRTLRRL